MMVMLPEVGSRNRSIGQEGEMVKMKVLNILFVVGLLFSGVCRATEPVVSFDGFDRPTVGSKLSAFVSGGDGYKYSWVWERADQARSKYLLVSQASYITVKDWNLEQWLRVTVKYDGAVIATKEIWVSTIPVVYLTTDSGNPIVTKDFYVSASVRIQGSDEFEQQYDGVAEVKGRGNSSWKYPQKPYKIKLDKKTDLFGYGANKHWVLIPNFNDKCGLRNKIASELAREMGLVAMDMTWVELIMNGEYAGSYMLAEHVRIGEDRVPMFDYEGQAEDVADALYDAIKKKAGLAKTDKSALETQLAENFSWMNEGVVDYKGKSYRLADYGISYDDDFDAGGFFYIAESKGAPSQFYSKKGVKVTVDKPEFAATCPKMLKSAQDYWQRVEDAYTAKGGVNSKGEHYTELADVDSMAAMMLLNEIMLQADPTNSRNSFRDKDSKLVYGPAWDYDFSSGTWAAKFGTGRDHYFTLSHDREDNYYRDWINDPTFCHKLYSIYWKKARPYMTRLLESNGEFDKLTQKLYRVGLAQDERWGDAPCEPLRPNAEKRLCDEDARIMKNLLSVHITWLDEEFASFKTLQNKLEKYRRIALNQYKGKTQIANVDFTPKATDGRFRMVAGRPHVVTVATESSARNIDIFVDGKKAITSSASGGWCYVEVPARYFVGEENLIVAVAKDSQGKVISSDFALSRVGLSKAYSITYDLAGGASVYTLPLSVNVDSSLSIPSPTKAGATFTGWKVSTKAKTYTINFSGPTYTFLNLTTKGDSVKLTALWKEHNFKISYKLNNGAFGASSPKTAPVDQWFYVSSPTKKGYTFVGWRISGDLKTATARYSIKANERVYIKNSLMLCAGGVDGASYKELANEGAKVVFTAVWTLANRPAQNGFSNINDSAGSTVLIGDLASSEGGLVMVKYDSAHWPSVTLTIIDESGIDVRDAIVTSAKVNEWMLVDMYSRYWLMSLTPNGWKAQ